MSLEKGADVGLSLNANRPHPPMDTIEDVDSTHSVTPTPTLNRPDNSSSPFSPFYDHAQAPTTLSLQTTKVESCVKANPKSNAAVYESDVEACLTESNSNFLAHKRTNTKDCTVWPSQKALKDANLAKRRRGECWNPMRGLEKRTKFWIKIAIAAVIVGVAVAVGLGISKAVGGGIWQTPGS